MGVDITPNYSGSVLTLVSSGMRLIPGLDKMGGIRTIHAHSLNGCAELSLTVNLLVSELGFKASQNGD